MNHPLLTSDTMSLKGEKLLEKIKTDFIGLESRRVFTPVSTYVLHVYMGSGDEYSESSAEE